MVTRAQLDKIGARLEALAVVHSPPLHVWVDLEETEQQAWQRAIASKPQDFTRPVVFIAWQPPGATG